MLARAVMSHPVVTVHPWTTVTDTATLLARHGFTAVPVLDDDNRLVGIVTEIDLLRGRVRPDPRRSRWGAGWSSGSYPGNTVDEVVDDPVESLTPGADVADAVRMMSDERIRCLPIVDGGTVVGVVTRRDLLRLVVHDDCSIARDVDAALAGFNDPDRWTVGVQAAVVEIDDFRDCADDRELARRLVSALPGVTGVTVRHLTPDPF